MISKLKILGLTLVAVFALSAVVASGASAEALFTSDGEVEVSGEAQTTFTAFGGSTICDSTYHLHKYNVTPHVKVPPNVKTITVIETHKNCTSIINGMKLPATVTMNGCDRVLHVLSAGVGQTTVVCPAGSSIETHVYSDAKHTTSICTTKVGPYEAEVPTLENASEGKITLDGPIKGITATKTGILCGGAAETHEASEDISIKFSGKNSGGGSTEISITG